MPDVVLPTLDEERALPRLIDAMPPGYRPIVVDNGSTDRSAAVAREHGAMVVAEPMRGFGSACWAGTLAATDDIICFMDADGSLDPAELPLVADPVISGDADLVLGRRVAARGAWPPHARVANRFLAWELRRRGIADLADIGPMRAMRRHDLVALGMTDRRFGWPLEMVIRAGRAGWTITEVDTTYAERTGRSKVTGTMRGTARAIGDMSRILRAIER